MKKLLCLLLVFIISVTSGSYVFAEEAAEAPSQTTSQVTAEAPPAVVYVRTGKDGYSEQGSGWKDSGLKDDRGGKTRLVKATASHAATYSPVFEKEGYYTAYIWKIVYPDALPTASVTVESADGSDTIEMNLTEGTTGWTKLGTYYFSAGKGGSISMSGTGGYLRVGPVKFEPATAEDAVVSTSLFSDTAECAFEEEIEFLAALGITDVKEGAFRPAENITYNELMTLIAHCMGLESAAETSEEVTVSYETVIGKILDMLGYDIIAAKTGVLAAANRVNLLKGIRQSSDEPVTRETAAKLIYNSLFIDIMQVTGVGEYIDYETIDGLTVLQEYMDIEEIEGRVTANYFTALTGESDIDEGNVKINGEVYFAGDTEAESYIGQKVKAYVREDAEKGGIKSILYVELKTYENDIITASAEDISPSTTTRQFRYTQDNKSKAVSIAINPVVIYNGKAKINYSAADFKPVYGEVTLIDSDSNGVFDVVIANHYKTLLVDAVDAYSNKIYFKYVTEPEWKSVSFEEENGKKVQIFDADGEETELAKIKEWDVMSVLVSADGKNIKAIRSQKRIRGKIESLGEDVAVINEKEYKIAYDAFTNPSNVKLNLRDVAVFYVDFKGNIVAIDYVDSESKMYGYMREAGTSGVLSKKLEFRIYSQSDQWQTLEAADKVIFNGNRVKKEDLMGSSLIFDGEGQTIKQLVSFCLDENGKVEVLNCVADSAENEPENVKMGKISLDFGDGATLTARGGSSVKLLGTQTIISDETRIFLLPIDRDDEDAYGMVSVSDIKDGEVVSDVMVYDMDEEFCAGAVTANGDGLDSYVSNSPVGVVVNVKYVRDENDDYLPTLTLMNDGKTVDISATANLSDAQFAATALSDPTRDTQAKNGALPDSIAIDKLEKGDVVQYTLTREGKLRSMRVLYRVDSPLSGEHNGKTFFPFGETSTYAASYYGAGNVEKTGKLGLVMNAAKSAEGNEEYSRLHIYESYTKCVIYLSETQEVINAKPTDIVKGDSIFIYKGMGDALVILVCR